MTADHWVRHLAANPDVHIKSPSTHTRAVPERHEDWWNPFSWSGDTWKTIGDVAQNVGAVAAGVAVGIGIGAAVAACVVATAGICAGAAVGVLVAGAVVAGAASSVTTYALSTGEKTAEGYLWSAGSGAVLGGLTGGIGVAAGPVLRAGQMVATQQTVAAGIRAASAPAAASATTATARFIVDSAGTAASGIKPGSAGGLTEGMPFTQSIRNEALSEDPSTCVYCQMETTAPQVDHAIPRAVGGNGTIDNAQTTCAWCNASKGPREFPVNPPPAYEGTWPPLWWKSRP